LHDKHRKRLIIQDKAKDSLYLKLAGDVDGSSAHELFNTRFRNPIFVGIFIGGTGHKISWN
jgi:hypothetical protein